VSSKAWKRQPEKRPAQIMEAAIRVFSEKGFRAATMDEVADAAGITKGTIYLYFESKTELFVEAVRAQLQEVLDLLPSIQYEPGADPEKLTKELGVKFLDVLMSEKVAQVIPLIIAEFKNIPVLKQIYFSEILSKSDFQVANLIEMGKALGLVRDVEPMIATRLLLGSFFLFALTQEVLGAKEVTPMNPGDIAATIATVCFRGLMKTEALP